MTVPEALCAELQTATQQHQLVDIQGGGSKRWLGNPPQPESKALDITVWQGVLDYHPEELVIRVKAGTPLLEVHQILTDAGQMLPFEPPLLPGATIGGTVAAGMSGSRRPYTGAVRDYVLGIGLISHAGVYQEFGGQVMKNVAGYDVARLVCGAHGMLGVIADVSLKVLPSPEVEISRQFELDETAARQLLLRLDGKVTPLSGSCYSDGVLTLRFSGSEVAVAAIADNLGGETADHAFWERLDCQTLSAFEATDEIWRLSTDWLEPSEHSFVAQDWGFAQRWLLDPATDPRSGYKGSGHWTCWRTQRLERQRFTKLPGPVAEIHQRLKRAFDPDRQLNRGRMYDEL